MPRRGEVEQRLATVEQQLATLASQPGGTDLRGAIGHLDQRLDRLAALIQALDARIGSMEARQDDHGKQLNARFGQLEARLTSEAADAESKIGRAREILSHRLDNERKVLAEHIEESLVDLEGRLTDDVGRKVGELDLRLSKDLLDLRATVEGQIEGEHAVTAQRLREVEQRLAAVADSAARQGQAIERVSRSTDAAPVAAVVGPDAGDTAERLAALEHRLDEVASRAGRRRLFGRTPPPPPDEEALRVLHADLATRLAEADTQLARLAELTTRQADLTARQAEATERVARPPLPEPPAGGEAGTVPAALAQRLASLEHELDTVGARLAATHTSLDQRIDEAITALRATVESRLVAGLEATQADQQRLTERVGVEHEAATALTAGLAADLTASGQRIDGVATELQALAERVGALDGRFHVEHESLTQAIASARAALDSRITAERDTTDVRIDEVLARLDATDEAVTSRATALAATLAAQVEAAQAELGDRVDSVAEGLGGRVTDLESGVEGRLAGLESSLGARIDAGDRALGDRLEASHTELAERLGTVDRAAAERLDAVRGELDGRLDAAVTDLGSRATDLEVRLDGAFADMGARLDAAVTEVGGRLDATSGALTERIDQARQEAADNLAAARAELDGALAAAHAELGDRIERVTTGIDDKVDGVRDELAGRIDEVHGELDDKVDGVRGELVGRIDGLDAATDADRAQLTALAGLMASTHASVEDATARLGALDERVETERVAVDQRLGQLDERVETETATRTAALSEVTTGLGGMRDDLSKATKHFEDITAKASARLSAIEESLKEKGDYWEDFQLERLEEIERMLEAVNPDQYASADDIEDVQEVVTQLQQRVDLLRSLVPGADVDPSAAPRRRR